MNRRPPPASKPLSISVFSNLMEEPPSPSHRSGDDDLPGTTHSRDAPPRRRRVGHTRRPTLGFWGFGLCEVADRGVWRSGRGRKRQTDGLSAARVAHAPPFLGVLAAADGIQLYLIFPPFFKKTNSLVALAGTEAGKGGAEAAKKQGSSRGVGKGSIMIQIDKRGVSWT